MSLATIDRNGAAAPATVASPAQSRLDEMWFMAESIARSKLFAVKTPDEAFALMLLCEAEGLHPVQALKRFHIIEGRPAMRSDAMQAEFQARGGVIKIVRSDATEARAVFSHPTYQPDGFEMSVTYDQFKATGMVMGKDGVKANWRHHAADMLWARLVTKAIRKIYPGIVAGIYSPEEIEDMAAAASPSARIEASKLEAAAAIAEADTPVPGWDPREPDTRPYHQLVTDAVNATNALVGQHWGDRPDPPAMLETKDVHRALSLKAIGLGYTTAEPPKSTAPAIKILTDVYKGRRQWVRAEVQILCNDRATEAAKALEAIRIQEVDPDIVAAAEGADDDEFDEPGAGG